MLMNTYLFIHITSEYHIPLYLLYHLTFPDIFTGYSIHYLRAILGVLQTIKYTNILSQHENKAFFQLFLKDTDMSSAIIKE